MYLTTPNIVIFLHLSRARFLILLAANSSNRHASDGVGVGAGGILLCEGAGELLMEE